MTVQEEVAPSVPGRFRLDVLEEFPLKKSGDVFKQAAQGSGGVVVPGGVSGESRCST